MCAPTYTKSTRLLSALSEKVKMCGNYVCVASGNAGSRIYDDWNLLLPCVPDILSSESTPCVSAGVFVQRLGNTLQLLTV